MFSALHHVVASWREIPSDTVLRYVIVNYDSCFASQLSIIEMGGGSSGEEFSGRYLQCMLGYYNCYFHCGIKAAFERA